MERREQPQRLIATRDGALPLLIEEDASSSKVVFVKLLPLPPLLIASGTVVPSGAIRYTYRFPTLE